MDELNIWLVGGGLAIGAVFAIVVQQFRFCLVAGTSNLLLIKDTRQAVAFATALLVLSGAVMKADGKVLKAELDYVKAFLNQQFSPQFNFNLYPTTFVIDSNFKIVSKIEGAQKLNSQSNIDFIKGL